MKPVAAGAAFEHGRLVNEDVTALKAASNVAAPDDLVNPYCFEPPVAPHIAAAASGVTIDLERLRNAYLALAALADCVVVEGVGGFRVPLGADFDTADLAARFGLPVLLVVGMRLGCINHALLTAAAIRAAGLPFAGWVANHIEPDMMRANENVTTLQERLRAPLLARISYSADPHPAAHGVDLDIDPLRSGLRPLLSKRQDGDWVRRAAQDLNCHRSLAYDKFRGFIGSCGNSRNARMNCVAGGETAEYVYTARRNNSLSSSGRRLVFGFILVVSLGIAAGFSLIFGAWPIMPFAGLEMAVLYFAFRYIDRHAADYERITIRAAASQSKCRKGER